MFARKLWLGLALLGTILPALAACGGGAVPDASKSISRDVIQSGGIVPAQELRVNEFLNYYPQHFPAPVNSTLGLDLRLGNAQVPLSGGEAWLQIGIQSRSGETEEIAPLNLALVIDCSGSMSAPEKMPYLKQSLRVFLHSLAANDLVALAAFNDGADLIAPGQRVGDGGWIDAAVERLQPGGSTNLYAGLMLGFQQVEQNFDVRRNNRVILLTDGIANVGVTDPNQIAADARAYNDKGIYLSTIGLGHDVNDTLLNQLATQGKGAYHFVDSAAEMDKIFHQEVTGLFQKSASEVSVVIRPDPSVQVVGLTGFDGYPPAGTIQVTLHDMGTGDSQVLLAHLSVGSGLSGRRSIASVELHYHDLFSQRDETISLPMFADASTVGNYNPLWDVEVLRNVTIQREAEGLKEIDRLYKAARYQEAWQLAYQLEQQLRAVAQLTNEDQMYKDADLMRTYEGTLSNWVQNQTGRPPQPPEDSGYPAPSRGRDPTPIAPQIEVH